MASFLAICQKLFSPPADYTLELRAHASRVRSALLCTPLAQTVTAGSEGAIFGARALAVAAPEATSGRREVLLLKLRWNDAAVGSSSTRTVFGCANVARRGHAPRERRWCKARRFCARGLEKPGCNRRHSRPVCAGRQHAAPHSCMDARSQPDAPTRLGQQAKCSAPLLPLFRLPSRDLSRSQPQPSFASGPPLGMRTTRRWAIRDLEQARLGSDIPILSAKV